MYIYFLITIFCRVFWYWSFILKVEFTLNKIFTINYIHVNNVLIWNNYYLMIVPNNSIIMTGNNIIYIYD